MFWFRFDCDGEDGWSCEEPRALPRAWTARAPAARPSSTRVPARAPAFPPAHTSITIARVRVGATARGITIEYVVGPDAGAGAVSVVVTLHDARGRIVRTLKNRRGAPGAGRVSWDGKDAFGAPAEPGLYYARLRAGGVVRLSSVWIP